MAPYQNYCLGYQSIIPPSEHYTTYKVGTLPILKSLCTNPYPLSIKSIRIHTCIQINNAIQISMQKNDLSEGFHFNFIPKTTLNLNCKL